MFVAPTSNEEAPWAASLAQLRAIGRAPKADLPGHAARAVRDAERALTSALARPQSASSSALVTAAGQLLDEVAVASADEQMAPHARRARLGQDLADRLQRFEGFVLEGEKTYEIAVDDADMSVAVAQNALALLAEQPTTPRHRLVRALDKSAVELASLLVRAAGNLTTEGRAGDATHYCPQAVRQRLREISEDIEGNAHRTPPARSDSADVGRHLAAALDACRPPEGHHEAGAMMPPAATADDWVKVAVEEYRAARALDAFVGTASYEHYFGGLSAAVAAGAANLLCATRLLGRAHQFRDVCAWGRQADGLTHATDAYTNARSGDAASYELAQLIIVTRLIRVVSAIALLEIGRA
jgi:hypothetical protein